MEVQPAQHAAGSSCCRNATALGWTKRGGDSHAEAQPERRPSPSTSLPGLRKGPMQCRVEGCGKPLMNEKTLYQRIRICKAHSMLSIVQLKGVPSRVCHKCNKVRHVEDFDGERRMCRACHNVSLSVKKEKQRQRHQRLAALNARTRRRQPPQPPEDGGNGDMHSSDISCSSAMLQPSNLTTTSTQMLGGGAAGQSSPSNSRASTPSQHRVAGAEAEVMEEAQKIKVIDLWGAQGGQAAGGDGHRQDLLCLFIEPPSSPLPHHPAALMESDDTELIEFEGRIKELLPSIDQLADYMVADVQETDGTASDGATDSTNGSTSWCC